MRGCLLSDNGVLEGHGQFKSLYQRTREEKAKGQHHTQKKEMFAGPPTLAGASEVGEAFAESSVHDKKSAKKWVFRIPILSDFGGQRVGDIFGDEVLLEVVLEVVLEVLLQVVLEVLLEVLIFGDEVRGSTAPT